MMHEKIKTWLQTSDPARLSDLWQQADAARQACVGDAVHLRGLVEVSNTCACACAYCGLRVPNRRVKRYRMTPPETVTCAHQAEQLGCGTVVLQAGEDAGLTAEDVAETIRAIKRTTRLAVTLSLGERRADELAYWRREGADRYLLRFETSNAGLFNLLHPGRSDGGAARQALLEALRELGYEVGSGVMVGVPGQSVDDLARDLLRFQELDLDMIGLGPYIAHPDTPLGRGDLTLMRGVQQVTPDVLTTCKALALARLLCPQANIPATTALATLDPATGYELGLQRGANVIMPNLTPARYRRSYNVYPGKGGDAEPARTVVDLRRRIAALDRTVGTGRGDSPNWRSHQLEDPNDRPERRLA